MPPYPLPSMKGLQALAALSDAGSLSAAARQIGVTRSALSHRIADLEKELGVVLIQTVGRSAALTHEAESLMAVMGDAFDRIALAVEPLRRRRMEIRLSTVATFASHWLLPRLPEFQHRHPAVAFTIATTPRLADFRNEDVDCAIRHGLGGWPGLTATLVFQETLAPVATSLSADLFDRKTPVIRARSRLEDWPLWWKRSGNADRAQEAALTVETRAQALDAALAGSGIAMTDLRYVGEHLIKGRLRLLGRPITLNQGYFFVHRPVPRNAALITAFGRWLIESANHQAFPAGLEGTGRS